MLASHRRNGGFLWSHREADSWYKLCGMWKLECPSPRHHGHLQTDLMVHDECMSQGVTDSYMLVIGHQGQEDAFSTPKSKGGKYLSSIGRTCDGHPSREIVDHSVWNNAADQSQVCQTKLAEQKVHWGVQSQVYPYQEEQDRVPNDGSKVDKNDSVYKEADILHI